MEIAQLLSVISYLQNSCFFSLNILYVSLNGCHVFQGSNCIPTWCPQQAEQVPNKWPKKFEKHEKPKLRLTVGGAEGTGWGGRGADGWWSAAEVAGEDLEDSTTSQHPGVPSQHPHQRTHKSILPAPPPWLRETQGMGKSMGKTVLSRGILGNFFMLISTH